MTTNEERQLGRAKNAVLSFLENRLIVPKIYLDANWGGQNVDVLAIERDGVGDVHAVILLPRKLLIDGSLDLAREWAVEKQMLDSTFPAINAQYKYIGLVNLDIGQPDIDVEITSSVSEKSFAPDGVGRVGFLKVSVSDSDDPKIGIVLKPERFRAKIAKLADEYVQQHEADWEIRA